MRVNYTVIMLLFLSLAISVMPIRLLGIYNTSFVVVPVSIVISFVVAFHYFILMKAKGLKYLELFIVVYPVLLVPLAMYNDHESIYVLTDVLKPIFWIGIIGYFKVIKINEDDFIKAIKTPVLLLTLCSIVVVVVVNYLIMTVGGVRASASDVVTLFPMFYYYVGKNYIAIMTLFLVFVFGGKVGPLFSLILVFIIVLMVKVSIRKIIKLFAGVSVVLFLFVYVRSDELMQVFPFLSKFSLVFSERFTFDELDLMDQSFFGGRLSEVISSIEVFKENPLLIITGPGVGYTYDLYRNGSIFHGQHHGVHFSPISMLTIYGAFYSSIFYGFLVAVFIKSLKIIKNNKSKLQVLAAMFFIASLANSFTVYSIFAVLLFPVCIGLVLSNNINNYTKVYA